ncbi:MAG: indolepyruvate ferredoxin oxidoreductase subunit beta [Candidatus Methanomethylicota archaeon]|uniref:Indolepyruvate ferredoxin oxidoreductase subunit beta n=1 Tax=Thermoproteota archaeon TaxID=2056631 RepID=A0A497ETV2_9CREN|nr:MAG: indolepyruvate ferredoxin oxidoreductase subunit beta [Candidatus Verstraetearchaeota archaeon]
MRKVISLIIAGVGGQGNVKAAQILGLAALKAGLDAVVSDVFGISQRGGAVISHVKIGEKVHGPLVAEHDADVVVGLEPMEALRAALKFAKPSCLILMNKRVIPPIEVSIGFYKYPPFDDLVKVLKQLAKVVIALDFSELAEKAGLPVATNIAMLGGLAATKILPINVNVLREAVKEGVPRAVEQNLTAFDLGFDAVAQVINR